MRVIPLKALIAYGILFLGLAVGSVWAQGVNVAQGKTATASSVWDVAAGSTADKAVDGIAPASYANIWHSGSGDRTPWWQVDLGRVYFIQRIVIWNRQDCCQNRLRDITVQIQGPGNEVLFETLVNPGDVLGGPATVTVTPSISVPGQFVKLSRTEDLINLSGDDQYLMQLAEVQVYDQTPLKAFGASPIDGALRVGANAAAVNQVDVNLSWFSGVTANPLDPNSVIIDPLLVKHKIYISNPGSTDPNDRYLGEVAAGSPPQATAQFGPVTLDRDATYYWRVDEVRSNGQTEKGMDWKFSTESAKPVIISVTPATQQAWSVESAPIAGETAESAAITVQAENPYSKNSAGMTYAWYKVIAGGDVKVAEGSPTFTIPTVHDADAGQYYCVVTLATPSTGTTSTSSNAELKIKHIIGFWPFDGNLSNQVGNVPGQRTTEAYDSGIVGQAATFDGTGNAAQLPTPALEGNDCTLSWWEKSPLGIANTGYMVSSGACVGYESFFMRRYAPDTYAGGPGNKVCSGNTYWSPTLPTEARGLWHFIAVKIDLGGTEARFYIDGVEVASVGGIAFVGFDSLIWVGDRRSGGRAYVGLIDDLRLYDFALSNREIAGLYTDVAGGSICLAAPANDFNGDCVISIADLALMAANWTNCNLVPASACN
jgi:hypothetical protein